LRIHKHICLLALICLAATARAASAQDTPSAQQPQPIVAAPAAPATPPPKPPAARPPRLTNLSFTSEKPVLGFPLGVTHPRAHCSVDGTAYFDLTASSANAGQDLYGISPDGSVKHILRKLPVDFTNVSVRDLFTGDQQIVTLLQADKRDDGTDASPPRETDYFLALEDTAGDLSDLVPLQLRFKPLRVARFGSGDIIVLGWDEGNLLPVLAMLKPDGTPHHFIDFESRKPDIVDETSVRTAARAEQRVTLDMLQGASFVAFANDVLLTYPGTTKPIREMSASGETFNIPIVIPSGYVLNDVLVSSGHTLILRVKEAPPSGKSDDPSTPRKMLVIEDDSYHGTLIRRLVFDKPTPADLTCAPNSSLSAIFYDTIPDADANSTQTADPAAAPPTQLVVSTTRR
jgi:hypothetical protein